MCFYFYHVFIFLGLNSFNKHNYWGGKAYELLMKCLNIKKQQDKIKV